MKFKLRHTPTAAILCAAVFYGLTGLGLLIWTCTEFFQSGSLSDLFKLSAFFIWLLFFVTTVFLLNGGTVTWNRNSGVVELSERDETKTGSDTWAKDEED